MKPYKYQAELDVYNEAKAAAIAATAKYLAEGHDWYPCGFVTVVIKPARGRFVSMLKDQVEISGENPRFSQYGYLGEYGGWRIYNPSENSTQSMYAKKAGAEAFVAVLAKLNIVAEVRCDID